jgi:drug/metabolite transporter (DMT)-like permease
MSLSRSRAALVFGGFTLCWALTESAAMLAGVSPYEIVWTRYGVHLAFMVLLFAPRKRSALVRAPDLGRQIFRSLLMLGMPVSFIWAYHRMPVDNIMAIFWITPLMVVALDRFAGHEARGWEAPTAAVVGFLGVLLILHPTHSFGRSAVLPVVMAACLALYIVMTRSMREEMLLPKLFHTAFWVFLALTPFVPLFWAWPTVTGWLALVAVGLLGWTALYLLDRAVDNAPTAMLAPILYSYALWTELLRWFIQGAAPGRSALLGSLVVVGAIGMAFVSLRERTFSR